MEQSQTITPIAAQQGYRPRYVLFTAAYNEQSFIAQTIESVIAQTVLPIKWVIVSDGSTDRTDEIVQSYTSRHAFIQLLRVERIQHRGVGSKVRALTRADRELRDVEYEFVGNLDADVTFGPEYFETLLMRFQSEPNLGISGGMIYEKRGGEFQERISNNVRSVAHAAQLVRRECYEAIGGYHSLQYGGEDWYAEITARMRGWRVEASSGLQILHHRLTGNADRPVRHCFREGKMDFSVGSHPMFEVLKCARRLGERPVVLGAFARFAGFCSSYTSGEPRLVSAEFVNFLRQEQKQRLKFPFRRVAAPALSLDHGPSSDSCC